MIEEIPKNSCYIFFHKTLLKIFWQVLEFSGNLVPLFRYFLPLCCFVLILGIYCLFRLFTRFILEAPALSESVVDFVKRYCEDNVSYSTDNMT